MNSQQSRWTTEDEQTLLEFVTNYVNKGKSKQEAFELVANILNRSKAACASKFRILLKNQEQIEANHKTSKITMKNQKPLYFEMTIEHIIDFLKNFNQEENLMKTNTECKKIISTLQFEYEQLNEKINSLKSKIQIHLQLFQELTE